MHFSSGNFYNLRNYQKVQNDFVPLRYRLEPPRYTRRTYSWLKGNEINKISDETLKIKIGGEDFSTKQKKRHQLKFNNKIKSTKYTIITFLPINLIGQFRRIANFYFLVMTIISILIDSPVSPITSLAPLVFVISVTAAKQGYEDYLRHKADNVVNHSLVTVLRNGKEINIRCEKILQGDLVIVTKDCDVPCDLVLLKTSDLDGKCFITTANLDGETNLKKLNVPKLLPKNIPDDRLNTLGFIECEQPKVDLYSFNGKITLSSFAVQNLINLNNIDEQNESITTTTTTTATTNDNNNQRCNDIPLFAENILLRGSRVKNTDWAVGCAVYVGQNTKMALNSRLTRNKVPSSESYVNKFLIVILFIQMSTVIFSYIMKRYYDLHIIENHNVYFGEEKKLHVVKKFLQDFLSFLILFNYLIPISLYVTIELHKFLGSFFMEWDRQLYDETTDQPCIVNTSDLNEELGQVNILFSDKTGTLTKNEMYFQYCSVKGEKYIYKNTKLEEAETGTELDVNAFNENLFTFFKALAICHTVQVSVKDENEMPLSERVQNIHTFDQIREENSNDKNNESEIDENDFIQIHKMKNQSDNNPLLNKTLSSTSGERIKISPKISRTTISRDTRIHPVDETTDPENPEHQNDNLKFSSIPSESSNKLNVPINHRTTSRSFNRSTSDIDISSLTNNINRSSHRRTQSYGMQQSFSQVDGFSSSSSSKLRTNLSRRESYVQPFYTQDSLLMRTESTKRKKEIRSVVEKLDYQSSSPDEKALIEAAAHLGIIYIGDVNDVMKICIYPPHLSSTSSMLFQGKKFSFTRLHVLEFTSDRKKMSVIVRDSQNKIWMYTKGAESYVIPLCTATSKELLSKTLEHVNNYASHGLRTLIVARRKLTEEEYRNFDQDCNMANASFTNRAELMADCYAKVEKDLELLGATAVEDALQDDVADTLISLQAAGVKIWVLTGDKVETALNIALSCGHIPEYASKYFITECCHETQIREHLRIFEHEIRIRKNNTYALLIDGISLATALKYTPENFAEIAIKCKAVLCCRLSPLQKCEVVQLMKNSNRDYITAAIGDGANDVSMIQEAHVGLGIVGKEGRQAACCADFSFSKFNMIKRLFFVHGHYHTYRLAMLVLYFFYKNTVFMGVQFLFQFHSMFSTESIYDSLFLTLYNVTYTALPILFLSLTEKPYKEEDLMRNPKMYKKNVFNRLLHWDRFFCWIFFGIYHAIICFYITYYVFRCNNTIFTAIPYTVGLSCFGTIAIHNVVVLVNIKLWMEAIFQSYIFIATIVGSILGFILTTISYNFLNVRYDKDIYWVYNNLLTSITFWMISFVLIILALLPDYTLKVLKALNLFQTSIFPPWIKLKNMNNKNINNLNGINDMRTTVL